MNAFMLFNLTEIKERLAGQSVSNMPIKLFLIHFILIMKSKIFFLLFNKSTKEKPIRTLFCLYLIKNFEIYTMYPLTHVIENRLLLKC